MKKTLLLIFVAFAAYNAPALAQDININLIGEKFSQAAILEKQNKGKIYTSDDDIIIPGGMAEPIVFTKGNKSNKDFYVEYTFSEKDSVIQRIEYKWGAENDKRFLSKKFELFLEDFNRKYGKSETVGQYQHHWTTKDRIEISIYGNFTSHPMVSVDVRKK